MALGIEPSGQACGARVTGIDLSQPLTNRQHDEIHRRLFDWLDRPVGRVTGATASPSISKVLERAAIARTDEVVTALRQLEEL